MPAFEESARTSGCLGLDPPSLALQWRVLMCWAMCVGGCVAPVAKPTALGVPLLRDGFQSTKENLEAAA